MDSLFSGIAERVRNKLIEGVDTQKYSTTLSSDTILHLSVNVIINFFKEGHTSLKPTKMSVNSTVFNTTEIF